MNNPASAPEPELDELYRELILDHYRHPHNKGKLEGAAHAEGYNPLCGDEIELDVAVGDGVIEDIAFSGRGCSISQASGSMMTDAVKGQRTEDAARIAAEFRSMMTEDAEPDPELGDLEAFQGVAKFPVRVKCATLAWRVLEDALKGGVERIELKGDER
jgi:nitrogen fixation protein NifU and related proteins